MSDRIPPSSLESEMATIGAALVSREAVDAAVDIVAPRDFYSVVHETIWSTITELATASKPVDKISVAERLRDRQKLEHVGGLAYLSSLCAESLGDASTAEYFANIVREKSRLRDLIAAGQRISSIGFDGEMDVDAAIAEAETAFSAAVDRGAPKTGGVHIYAALKANYMRLLERSTGTVDSDAILTPYPRLNKLIGAVMPGEMVLWPAAAKSGKSANLFQLCDFIAAHYGAVALASLEMQEAEISMRYGALYGGVSVRRQREGDLSEYEFTKIALGIEKMAERPLYLYDLRSVMRLSDLRRELRVLSRTQRIRALCIDGINFLGDVDAAKGDRSTKNDRMDFVYRSLLRLAKEFGLVVHAVQHVNREGMNGPPTMRDIRDGGNPEGHAHAIVAPYRPRPNGTPDERREGKFIVLGAREGESGVVDNMEFVGARSMWLEGGNPPWFEPQPEPVEEPQMEFV
jgi:replicative DNA helicase